MLAPLSLARLEFKMLVENNSVGDAFVRLCSILIELASIRSR